MKLPIVLWYTIWTRRLVRNTFLLGATLQILLFQYLTADGIIWIHERPYVGKENPISSVSQRRSSKEMTGTYQNLTISRSNLGIGMLSESPW